MSTEHQRKHLNFKRYGLTLVFGDSIGKNVIASMIQAEAIAQTREFGQVLYLNTFQTDEGMDETCAAAVHRYFTVNTQDLMSIENSTVGELANDQGMMSRNLVGHFPAKVIIINSWEFASRDCRLRERLLFRINEWITHYGASVIVYAEARNRSVELGKCQIGGFGKLTALTNRVENICGKPLERDPRYIEYENRVDRQELDAQKRRWDNSVPHFPLVETDIEPAFRLGNSKTIEVKELKRPEPEVEVVKVIEQPGVSVETPRPSQTTSARVPQFPQVE
ncbi:MAG TPA: hypothetical protein VFO76_00485, partial [Candidatus Kapabacteria bacterium]|nr:hypothetical protein [Candidatus Kapabacteria bacterium]